MFFENAVTDYSEKVLDAIFGEYFIESKQLYDSLDSIGGGDGAEDAFLFNVLKDETSDFILKGGIDIRVREHSMYMFRNMVMRHGAKVGHIRAYPVLIGEEGFGYGGEVVVCHHEELLFEVHLGIFFLFFGLDAVYFGLLVCM
jgi:hypothetical protein